MRSSVLRLLLLLVVGCTEDSTVVAQHDGPASAPSSKKSTPLPTPAKDTPLGKNFTKVDYQAEDRASCDGRKPCACSTRDLEFGRPALAQLGIPPAVLDTTVQCLLADYDGNGFTDLAVLGPKTKNRHSVKVLLFDEIGLSNIRELPKPVRHLSLDGKGSHGQAILAGDDGVIFIYLNNRFQMAVKAEPATGDDLK